MESIARNQFPQFVWRDGEKHLWNPIHRKTLKNRPEERVRLRIIEALIRAGWSKHRISTEEAIKDYAESNLRTDIICYNQAFDPQILAECKAENISLTTKTAEQIARYNRNVQAPFLLITNGTTDFWYRIAPADGEVEQLESLPELLSMPETTEEDFDYWQKRGFTGTKAVPPLRKWLLPVLEHYQATDTAAIKYLRFEKSPSDLNLSHYYHIHSFEDEKIAISFLGTAYGGTRMIAILNREGTNRAVAEVNLDLVFEGEEPDTSIYSAEGVRNVVFNEQVSVNLFNEEIQHNPVRISAQLKKLFDNIIST
ncbi:type I restriction enzyme HsdR N-terminal domain-containing protein [Balneolaceae bacterium YR4-1]|uniref:Type I restriction enzyme HsdR N-terminal domain-containing protein n=1 Tax=Halalkalibaculum roseum TaxID=2709311 RepID=A0A6M1SSW8_9BACT|nr:type I restriction enzyme HsdR N-terminal domain-containing protein [Halalkalibaculum roseum]NGP75198.1 type I restriction enzyme HsdR N-terminal domain-containing protein [Halalkalibaculum roseum]